MDWVRKDRRDKLKGRGGRGAERKGQGREGVSWLTFDCRDKDATTKSNLAGKGLFGSYIPNPVHHRGKSG